MSVPVSGPRRVSIFVTCMVDQLFPRIGLAMAEVLELAGFTVEFPEAQTCCGQPAFNSGYVTEAREVAEHFLKVFEASDWIVVPSGSCTAMIVHHFADLFPAGSPVYSRVEGLSSRVREFSSFLTEVAGVEDVGARWEGVVTFHDGCHGLRELGIRSAPRRLLARVRILQHQRLVPEGRRQAIPYSRRGQHRRRDGRPVSPPRCPHLQLPGRQFLPSESAAGCGAVHRGPRRAVA